MQAPLQGVRVVDLSRALAGPVCTALLGDLGAGITKVEMLPHGDPARSWGPFKGGKSLYSQSVNRNKRSLALDPRTQEGRLVLRTLVDRSDVLVENFRPGIMRQLGLDPAELRETHPQLVIASINGFGPVGPYKDRAGMDQVAQGMSGLMSLIGEQRSTPMRVGVPICDALAGITTAFGIAGCLVGRERCGSGSYIQSSLLESALGVLTFQAQRYLSLGEVPGPQGNHHGSIAPYGVFRASDEAMSIAVATPKQWQLLCGLIGRPELVSDSRFDGPTKRLTNRDALVVELEEALSKRTADEWTSIFTEAGIPCGPIHTVDKVFSDPQVEALGVTNTVDTGAGDSMTLLRGPLWLDGEPTSISAKPPDFGADTDTILSELGYSPQVIDDLRARGIVGTARQ